MLFPQSCVNPPLKFASKGVFILVGTFLVAPLVLGHGDVHLQIDRLTAMIEQAPTAELYLKRGDMHRLDENFRAALADLDRAEQLNPDLNGIFLLRGRTQFEAGRCEQALEPLNRLLAVQPDHPEGLTFRARSLVLLSRHEAALKDYNHLMAIMPSPSPDCFLERAACLSALGHQREAIRSLDEGVARLGELLAFHQAAIRFELRISEYDQALKRIDKVLTHLQRREIWLERRGDVLRMAGRVEEARAAYAEALAALNSLPPYHQETTAMRDLKSRLTQHLPPFPSNITSNAPTPEPQ